MAGIWLIGAYGAVSTTTMTGIAAIKAGAAPRVQAGIVTEAPECDPIRSKFPLEKIALGGHEVRFLDRNAYQASEKIWEENVHFQRSYLDASKNELSKIFAKKGTAINCGPGVDALGDLQTLEGEGLTLSEIVGRLMKDYDSFKNKNGDVCVINAASTEPHITLGEEHQSLDAFEGLIDENKTEMVTASMLYAYAAIKQKIPYGNFTPSHGATVPAIRELAVTQKIPYMGDDGKTGETLMKTTLAPMFKMRNLKILGWAGFNILGDDDGVTLSKDKNKESKIESKDKAISSISSGSFGTISATKGTITDIYSTNGTITNIAVGTCTLSPSTTVAAGALQAFVIPCSQSSGERVNYDVTISYSTTGSSITQQATGSVSGRVP